MNYKTYRQAKFSQGAELVNASPDRKGGICHGLSMSWCNEYLAAPKMSPRGRMQLMHDKVGNSLGMQAMLHANFNNQGLSAATANMAPFFKLRMTHEHRIAGSAPLYNQLRQQAGTPMVMSLDWERAAHSIALHWKRGGCLFSGTVRVFDPNFGEYKMKTSSFVRWFTSGLLPAYTTFGRLRRVDLRMFDRRTAVAAPVGGIRVMPIAA